MPSNWNVNDYKTDFESEEHWELRRSFMLAHKDKLPEDEIVCLAQVFTNIELLGCRYPDETMKKVAELAKGVVEPYRERKKNCLKRTFVAASDAAVAKVKGQRSSSELNQTNELNDTDEIDQINPMDQTMHGIEVDAIQTNPTVQAMQGIGIHTIQTNPAVQAMQGIGIHTIQTNPTFHTMQGMEIDTIQTNPTGQAMQGIGIHTIPTNPAFHTMQGIGIHTIQTNPTFHTIQGIEIDTNPTFHTVQGIEIDTNPTFHAVQGIEIDTFQTNPTFHAIQGIEIDTFQTNPTVQAIQGIEIDTIETNPTVQTMEGIEIDTIETNPTVQAMQGIEIHTIETNPTVQTMEGIEIHTIQTNPAFQANPTVQKMQKLQTSPTIQKMQELQINPTVPKMKELQTNPTGHKIQKIRVNSAVQTNQTIQKNQTHQAIQTVQTTKVDQMVQTTKVDQTVQTYLPYEATQIPKATHTTQGTQTTGLRIHSRVKNQNPTKKQKNKKRNNKKTPKKNKERDADNDMIDDDDGGGGDGDDGALTIITNAELTDIKRCIWDDVEISGHTNSHSDQINTNKGNNSSDNKQSSAIEFLAASTNAGYTLDPTGVKKLNELKPRFVFFLYDEPPVNLLQRNATLNRGTLRWHFDGQKGHRACSVYYNGILLGSSDVCAKKLAKEKAAKEAIKNLRSLCYTVKIKKHVRCLNKVTPAALGCPDGEIKLKSAIGEQIMRLMGWSGGGLGVKQQGMIQPVSLLPNTGRDGLGLTRNLKQDPGFRKRADAFLKRWIQTDSEEDLVFSTDFTHAQREILHKVASDLNLKSRSYGKNEDRYIVIYKKPVPWLIVEKLVKMGGSTNRYELLIPTVTIP